MKKSIVDYLDDICKRFPDKKAFIDLNREVTYQEFVSNSKRIGTYISTIVNDINTPMAIFIDKTINCLESMIGIIYSGNFYTVLDTKSPQNRIETIIENLDTNVILTDYKNLKKIQDMKITDKKILIYEEIIKTEINEQILFEINEKRIDTDIMYILFTSGSTGVPKGVVITHRAVLSYIKWVQETFKIDEKTIWGSQTPFYFSMSITDVFTTMMCGATMYIIPKINFSFPINLIKYLKENKINTIYWVPSALCIVANLGALDKMELPDLFAGEVMPVRQLNMWMDALPNTIFANLYGPTETTDICSYYIIENKISEAQTIPIGRNCNNCNLIVVNENGQEIKFRDDGKESESGELLVRGSFLAEGYYNNPKKTKEVFIQNPINDKYPEKVYKTGDIVKFDINGNLIYISRKDYQIKHMGYRIELGEIEKNIYSIEGITLCVCIYDDINQNIILYYQGEVSEEQLAKIIPLKLVSYMRPHKYKRLVAMPYNSNGKIDRKFLKQKYMEELENGKIN